MVKQLSIPSQPVLASIPRVELGAVGTWNISNADDWHPTAEDFASAVAALGCPSVRRPVLKFGHTGEPGEGDPAIGIIDNMAVTEDGQTLVGDFVGVPAWLAAEDGNGHSVLSSAYPDRSGEWQHDYVCQLGHTHPFVLHAMALLGVVRPGIGTLESLHDLYTKAPAKESVMPAASTGVTASSVTPDQVRKAYYAGPGTDWNLYVREMFIDPPELIVQDDSDDTLTRVAYELAADGEVTFGDPQTVKVEYVAARAGAGKPVVAFASRAESRPPQSASALAEDNPEKEKAPMPTLNEVLRQRLGIAESADEADILAALDEALPAEAEEVIEEEQAEAAEAPAPELQAASTGDVVTVDRAQWEATIAAAAEGRQARQQQVKESDEALVSAAIAEGKIPPARRDHWLASLGADREGTTQTLAKLEKGLIPLAEVGHAKSSTTISEDAAYAALFGKEA